MTPSASEPVRTLHRRLAVTAIDDGQICTVHYPSAAARTPDSAADLLSILDPFRGISALRDRCSRRR